MWHIMTIQMSVDEVGWLDHPVMDFSGNVHWPVCLSGLVFTTYMHTFEAPAAFSE